MVSTTFRGNEGQKREAWTAQEDNILASYIRKHGEGKWINVPKQTGLRRSGKSCRLRWMNFLRPDIKRGNITEDEEDLILRLHKLLGNRWSLIAGRLPGRTDHEIKNYWNTYLAKREQEKQSYNTCQHEKKEIAEAGISHVYDEASEGVTLQPMASPSTHMVLDTLNPIKPTIDCNGHSDVATVEPVVIDRQSTPRNYEEEKADGSFMDFDFGDVSFLEFLDLDFAQLTDCEMLDTSSLKPEGSKSESPPL